MGRSPCCDRDTVKKGTWSSEEDAMLKSYMEKHGNVNNWIALPPKIGLNRCGKSCRLRWLNYLRPDIKHGKFSEEEDNIISSLYFTIGSRWSKIAEHLDGRTDNDIKNYWNTKLKKKLLGHQKKFRRRSSFAGSHETRLYIDNHYNNCDINNNSATFTITNGHLMSSNWPVHTAAAAAATNCWPLIQEYNAGGEKVSMISFTVTSAYDHQHGSVNINDNSSSRQANINNISNENLDTNLTREIEELLFSNSPSHNNIGGGSETGSGESMESWDWADLSSLLSPPDPMDELFDILNYEEILPLDDALNELSYTGE